MTCQLTTKVNNNQTIHIISAYAPTLDKSEKNPEMRDQLYSKFGSIIKIHKAKHMTVVSGDFNAKVGWKPENHNTFE